MKQKNLLLTLIAFLLFQHLSAQYCGGSGTGVCTAPSTLPAVGFYPSYDSAACAVIGQPYDQTVFFLAPPTVTQGTTTYNLNYIIIDTVSNLPCGMCWRSGNAQNRINGNATGCVRVTGTTFDAVGQYKLRVIVTANVRVGIFNVNVGNQNAEDLGVKYWIRVQAPGGVCAPVDTLATGRTTTATGAITAPTISGNTTICTGQSTTLSVAGNYQTYVWSTGSLSSSINVSAGGNYRVTVYNNCSSATAAVNVNLVTPNPVITPAGPISICSGSSVTLDAGAGFTTYNWSNGATTQTTSINQTGNYSCTVTQSGCTGTATAVSVTVNSVSPLITAGGPTTFCQGGNVTLDAGANYSTYAWSTGATTQTINVTQSGSYTCSVTQNNCPGTSNTIVVTVNNPQPVVTPAGPVSICSGIPVTLDAGAGYSAYQWSNGAQTRTISPLLAGNYTCTVTQNGCLGVSNTVNVSVVTLNPTIFSNGPTTFCSGGSVAFDAGSGYSTYTWSSGETTQSIVVTQGGTYTCTVTQGNCSAATNSVTVTVTSNSLSPQISPSTINICPGGSADIDVGTGYDTYTWSTSATTQAINVSTAGTYIVTVTLGTCSGVDSVEVTDNNIPIPVSITALSLTACAGENITLNATVGYGSYAWSNGSAIASAVVQSTDSYTVTATQNGCTGTDVVSVTFNPIPTVSLTPSGTQSVCVGDSLLITATSGYATYAWNNLASTESIYASQGGLYFCTVTNNGCTGFSDTVSLQIVPNTLSPVVNPAIGEICAGGSITLDAGTGYSAYTWSNSDATQTTSASSAGTYTVTVTQGVCAATASAVVNIVTTILAVDVSPSGPISICEDSSVTLNAGAGFESYLWSNNATTQTIQPTTSGSYIVMVMKNGCMGEDTVDVTLNPLPVLSISPAGPINACEGDAIQLTATANQGTYTWSNGLVTNSIFITNPGSYSVTATLNGCSASSSNAVSVTLNPVPDASVSIQQGVGTLFTLTASPAGQTYFWQYAIGNDTTGPLLPLSVNMSTMSVNCVPDGGYYRVVITGAGNCTDTSSFILVPVCQSIERVTSIGSLALMPNPVSDRLYLKYDLIEATEITLDVLDITGKLISNVSKGSEGEGLHTSEIVVSGYAKGMYMLKLSTNEGSVYKRFVVE